MYPFRKDEPMSKHTSFKTGGKADYYIEAQSVEDIKNIKKYAKENNLPIYILGNGSNILVTDKGIRGIVLKINLQKIEIQETEEDATVTAGAGVKMMLLAQKLLQKSIAGFEELSGIPGTIGGAIKMNAGAYGKEMKDLVISTQCMDKNGNIVELSNQEQKFAYRNSIFFEKDYVITETVLKLHKGNKEEIHKKMEQFLNSRKEKQPLEYPSAGSTFKRGEDFVTAKLIDECNLKGFSIGGAQISEKHAGFIINKGGATSQDIIDLIEYTKRRIYEKFKIHIHEEIQIIGE